MHLPFYQDLIMNRLSKRNFRAAAVAILLVIAGTTTLSAAGPRSPYGHDPRPLRLYYYGYDLSNPGFGLGMEVNLSWTKMEKSGCKGSRVSDRQFRMIPNIGMFSNETGAQSVFGNLEFNYGVTYRHGLTLEWFGAAGYAQNLGEISGTDTNNQKNSTGVETPTYSGFMPMAGMGIGYDFQKLNGKDFPLELNFRGLASSVNITEVDIKPGFQAGLTYSF